LDLEIVQTPPMHIGLTPWFITGFVDAEGSFSFSITKSLKSRFGWIIAPRFSLTKHIRDLALLQDIKSFFGGIGYIKVIGNRISY
jgi:hypothetical protein